MKRLLAYGCSHTYGESLPDCLCGIPMPPPSKFSWPYLLAQKLSLECVNHAVCGASNKEIQHCILGADITKNDTVVVLWTHHDRSCVLINDYNHNQYMPSYTEKRKGNPPARRELNRIFYRYFFNDFNAQNETYVAIDHTYRYLLSKGIKVFNFTFSRDEKAMSSEVNSIPNWFSTPVKNLNLLNDFGADGMHPGVLAHADIAEQAYTILNC